MVTNRELTPPMHFDTVRPYPTLVKNHFVLTPFNHSLQAKDRSCLLFGEI